MSEYGSAHAEEHGHGVASPISVPWVVAAAILCALGLSLIWYWLTTFDWIYFTGPFVVLAGALMLMNHRAGLDHA
jgi:hypothetical protein